MTYDSRRQGGKTTTQFKFIALSSGINVGTLRKRHAAPTPSAVTTSPIILKQPQQYQQPMQQPMPQQQYREQPGPQYAQQPMDPMALHRSFTGEQHPMTAVIPSQPAKKAVRRERHPVKLRIPLSVFKRPFIWLFDASVVVL